MNMRAKNAVFTVCGWLLTGCVVFSATRSAASDDYLLGVMDKVHIRVAEWQTSEGIIRDWSSVTGEYTVGPSGKLSIPFLGEVPAVGRPTSAIADDVGSGLEILFGLKNRPSASVEVSEFRPVFVSGDVDKPGQYAFTPNLTVSKAVTLSGGLRRADAGARIARDFITAKGEVAVSLARRGRLLARKARLQAEIADRDEITAPKELKNFPDADELLASESELMVSRKKRLTLQLEGLEDLKSLLGREIVSLAKKTESQTRQLDLAEEDLVKVEALAEKGLALSARKLGSEQRAADIQATLLDIDTSTLRAKQDISKADQSKITLQNDWSAQLAQELQDTTDEIDKVDLQVDTGKGLISEALEQSKELARFAPGEESNVSYTVVREIGATLKEVGGDETTILQPGDQVKVKVAVFAQ